MVELSITSHKVAWEHPYPVKNQIGKYLVEEGANFPKSLTEDIRGISLCPTFSLMKLRTIERRKKLLSHFRIDANGGTKVL
jgi:hypothetical protein